LKEKEQAVAEEINEYRQKNMAEHNVPVWVEFRMELPESNVGKFLRKIVREQEEAKKTPKHPS
jgi:long-chain acyl-CoA synthetase